MASEIPTPSKSAPRRLLFSRFNLNSARRKQFNPPEPAFGNNGPLGLTTIYEPDEAPVADLVFVHGLGGHSYSSWCYNKDPSLFWPKNWLPEEPALVNVRIHTFGYSCPISEPSALGIDDFAKSLVIELQKTLPGSKENPIPLIFAGHSSGGLVIKRALILGRTRYHPCPAIDNVCAILFFATPHRGSKLVQALREITAVADREHSPSVIDLTPGSAMLESLNDEFRHHIGDIRLFSFFETQPMAIGTLRQLMVEKSDAVLWLPNEQMLPMGANHRNIVNYTSPSDPSYTVVKGVLISIVRAPRGPAPSASPSVYEPLAHENSEIRLLCLVEAPPGPSDAPLKCTLSHVPLPRAPAYVAVSYHWGDTERTATIEVNGVEVKVTPTLEAALRRLRSEGVLVVWADALCINQKDKKEKSIQIPRMGAIFRKASEVAIWLGPDAELDESAQRHLSAGTMPRVDPGTCPSGVPVFKHLLERPYWRRIWIIQELAVASRIRLYWGRYVLPWEMIDLSCSACQMSVGPAPAPRFPVDESCRRFQVLRSVRAKVLTRRPIHLLDALHRTIYALATDPRDKIFALLGLTFDGSHFVPEPSYVNSVVENFVEFAAALLMGKESLDLIYLRSSRREAEGELPSWVPDWADLDDPVGHRQFGYVMANGGPEDLESDEEAEVNMDGLKLHAKAMLLDSVEGLSSALEWDGGCANAHEVTSAATAETPYGSENEAACIIYQTLLSSELLHHEHHDEMTAEMGGAGIFSSLGNRPHSQTSESYSTAEEANLPPHIRTWVARNRNFMVCGQPLESWIQRWSQLAGGNGDVASAERQLSRNIESGMRLLVTRRGRLGWVHPQARKGDIIARVFGCRRFVVLRSCADGYRVVGDASISGLSTAEVKSRFPDVEATMICIV